MKKMIMLILVMVLVISLAPAAFAESISAIDGTDSADVKATYQANETATVYCVDITWSGLEFTYNSAYKGVWNAQTHEYENATPAGWAEAEGTITVTNHSNTDITASPKYTPVKGYGTVTMKFSEESLLLATADNGTDGAAGKAVEGSITVTPEGALPENTASDTVIGRITITIQ